MTIHPVLAKLKQIIQTKKTNLALSADVTKASDLFNLIEKTKDHICLLKTHIDILEDFTPEVAKRLRVLADQHHFLIFEDRKFADIGHTVYHQVRHGIYRISSWADIINAHILPGEGIIEGLKSGCKDRDVALLLLAQMSSANNYFTQEYTKKAVELAQKHRDFVIGFIAQEKLTSDDLIVMTPGIQFENKNDNLGQQYHTPEKAIINCGSDIVIVGRGIYQSDDPEKLAKVYKERAYQAYLQRLGVETI